MSHKPAGCFKTFKDYLNQQELDDYDLSESKQDKDKYNKSFQSEIEDAEDNTHLDEDKNLDRFHDPMDLYHQYFDLEGRD